MGRRDLDLPWRGKHCSGCGHVVVWASCPEARRGRYFDLTPVPWADGGRYGHPTGDPDDRVLMPLHPGDTRSRGLYYRDHADSCPATRRGRSAFGARRRFLRPARVLAHPTGGEPVWASVDWGEHPTRLGYVHVLDGREFGVAW